MAMIERSIDVNRLVSTVYNQWTQFESFPEFMEGVLDVHQIDDNHVYWRAQVGGREKEWDAEITEQIRDQKISWRTETGAWTAGSVAFEPIGPSQTRLTITMEYKPEGIVEKAGDVFGLAAARVEGDLRRFKEFIESRSVETGAWRGEIHHEA